MNYYKLFKYFPDNHGFKSCLSYRNLVTFYNYYKYEQYKQFEYNLYNLNIIYVRNNDTQYYCKL